MRSKERRAARKYERIIRNVIPKPKIPETIQVPVMGLKPGHHCLLATMSALNP